MCKTCDGLKRLYVENSYSFTVNRARIANSAKKEESRVA
jgi:hypothetical protein